jgi:hypothetical protein
VHDTPQYAEAVDALVNSLFVALIGAAVLPLLALLAYAAASALGLGFADRILEVTKALLTAQWGIGGALNMLIGAALVALGIWCAVSLEPATLKASCLVLIPFGIWRLVRGLGILRAAARGSSEAQPPTSPGP